MRKEVPGDRLGRFRGHCRRAIAAVLAMRYDWRNNSVLFVHNLDARAARDHVLGASCRATPASTLVNLLVGRPQPGRRARPASRRARALRLSLVPRRRARLSAEAQRGRCKRAHGNKHPGRCVQGRPRRPHNPRVLWRRLSFGLPQPQSTEFRRVVPAFAGTTAMPDMTPSAAQFMLALTTSRSRSSAVDRAPAPPPALSGGQALGGDAKIERDHHRVCLRTAPIDQRITVRRERHMSPAIERGLPSVADAIRER